MNKVQPKKVRQLVINNQRMLFVEEAVFPKVQFELLKWLEKHGGSAQLDGDGCLIGEDLVYLKEVSVRMKEPLWLRLISQGYVSGDEGKLFLTEKGKKMVQKAEAY